MGYNEVITHRLSVCTNSSGHFLSCSSLRIPLGPEDREGNFHPSLPFDRRTVGRYLCTIRIKLHVEQVTTYQVTRGIGYHIDARLRVPTYGTYLPHPTYHTLPT